MGSNVSRVLKRLVCGLFTASLWYAAVSGTLPATAQQKIDFVRDIQPIFQQTCYQCHGSKKAMGQLRLDDKRLAFKGGASGPAIIPGDGRGSRLMQRIRGEGGEQRMPLGGDPLKPGQIAMIARWINQGANWPSNEESAIPESQSAIPAHWAYVKPVRPALPSVKDAAWARNPIDNFILARLEKEGVKPSPEARPETLLRRVYLDLTGLPPSVKEVDEFLADKSPDAYEKVVDRLLGSPHYGERWARPWLDLARYADSNGYEKDRPRVMWAYRDWVINALNRDMPFDQFTVEQIAGDMLPPKESPEATAEQKIATGFHRNTMLNQEGGVDDEEARWETIGDRVSTTGAVWLGATIGCAQCHNHKYDPFSQKDYYKLFAFFDNAVYKLYNEGQSESWVVEPEIDLPTPEQEARRRKLQTEINDLQAKMMTATPELDAAMREWERETLAEPAQWIALDPAEFKTTGGSLGAKLEDKSLLVTGPNPEQDEYIIVARSELKGITGLRLEALTDARLPQGGPGRDPYGNFLLTGFEVVAAPADDPAKAERVVFKTVLVDDSANKFQAEYLLGGQYGASASKQIIGWAIDATRDQARLNRQAVFLPPQPFGFARGTVLTIKLKSLGLGLGQGIGRVRLSLTTCDDPRRIVSVPAQLRHVLEIPPEQRTGKQTKDLAEQFRSTTPILKPARDRLKELREEMKRLGIVSALVMQERPSFERPFTYFRERGSFLSKGEKVYAGTPAALHPMPESQPFNRLGLARWLADENNPLTSRVTVNRFWEQIFGRGIVETSEDFGTQGAAPSHPELLDWLATEFPRRKWSMKAMIRLMVTSATYRQSSSFTPALLERDPYNRLLARGPRFRLEAEMVRDVALAASGVLSRRIGGPSVFPPQPEGIWRIPHSDDRWETSKGEDRYRRSLYTFLRRTSPYPAMMTFDATSREYCVVRRVRTNTPLQALTALNDEAFFDAARGLAKRMIAEAAPDARSRAIYGFRLCLARAPKAEELDRILALYDQQISHFNQNAPAARQVIGGQATAGAAELAAWIIVANALLNLDETLTKQ